MSGYLATDAIFSDDGLYRYALMRRWEEGRRTLVVIGLNPSTADKLNDDPTIRRCISFAKRERCAALTMLNLYALRSTSPDVLWTHVDPVGPENDATIRRLAWGDAVIVVAAWGADGGSGIALFGGRRPEAVRRIVPALNCWGTTKDGYPRHPLYLRSDAPLVPYYRAA